MSPGAYVFIVKLARPVRSGDRWRGTRRGVATRRLSRLNRKLAFVKPGGSLELLRFDVQRAGPILVPPLSFLEPLSLLLFGFNFDDW